MRKLALLLVAAMLGAACSGDQDIYEVAPTDEQLAAGGGVSEEQIQLPKPVPAIPVFAVKRAGGLAAKHVRGLDKMKGSAAVAPLHVKRVAVEGPKKTVALRVGAVDPFLFRSLAPPSTRSADFVWLSLMGGDAVLTHEAGKKLGVNGAKEVRIPSAGRYRVGALADNGTPNHVDILIATPAKGWKQIGSAVFGARTGANLATIEQGIRSQVKGARLTRLIPRSETVVRKQESGTTLQAPTATLAGLHPTMGAAVQTLLRAAGGRVWVVSGYRDASHQQQLWFAALDRYGDPEVADNWVARPGHSMHEHGLAVDLGGDLEYAVHVIQELDLPLWRPMSWEPWHFEFFGSRG
jgi:hypothetical protein